jgi:hypothetical protein
MLGFFLEAHVRMRTVIGSFVTAALLAFASPAAAQDQPVTVSGGVSFFHFNDCCTEPGFRVEVAKAFRQTGNGTLALFGELGWTGSDGDSTLTLGAGPRLTFGATNSGVQPFVHVVVGLARYSFEGFDGGDNNFLIGPGGGVTFPVNDRVNAFGQIEFMIVKGDGFTDYGQRFTFGVSFELGQ